MNRTGRDDRGLAELDNLIETITVDAYGDDEQFWAFRQAFEDKISVPVDGFVIGEPVSVIEFDYEGNERRGLTARCRRDDGSEHVVSASEIVLPQRSLGASYVAAYRKWQGLDPYPPSATETKLRQHKAKADDLDLTAPIELVVVSVKENAARCRLLDSDRTVTLRARLLWDAVPGTIITVKPNKRWSFNGHPYLSGEVEATRLDAAALDLVPLRLEERGVWKPDANDLVGDRVESIIARDRRLVFEMEQVRPGLNSGIPFSDPIVESNELKEAGYRTDAYRLLMDLCQSDLRCLDAHAHLGDFVFGCTPGEALCHYEVGLRIGELSLGSGFDGLLPWEYVGNRPFLHCLHGFGLCLWRLGRFEETEQTFDRMLHLNPSDDQGVRVLIEDVRARKVWEELKG
ncbi:MAG TPA: cytoplasmic protein [Cyanobacteria bacterium UBA8530]|nr:cytoplasmic protein [Cyanobacteria bacterium UBA8530]